MSAEDWQKINQQRKAMQAERYKQYQERQQGDPDQFFQRLRKERKDTVIEANHKDCGEDVEVRRDTCLTTKKSILKRRGCTVDYYNFELHNIEQKLFDAKVQQ